MNTNEALLPHIAKYSTAIGGAFVGTRAVFRGEDIHKHLMHMSWHELQFYGITGRKLSPEDARLWETLFVLTSYPDARIWNNRVAALAGTTRSTATMAISAANAVSEATIYGRQNEAQAIMFFTRTKVLLDSGVSMEECLRMQLARERKFPGYGRPIAADDERIIPAMEVAKKAGRVGPHVKLAFEIEEHLVASKGLKMNYGALISAFAADFGLTSIEFNLFIFPSFIAGMNPCYVEALTKAPGSIMPVRCADVQYNGVEQRNWVP